MNGSLEHARLQEEYEEMIASEAEYGEPISEEDEYKRLCEENRQLNRQACEEFEEGDLYAKSKLHN